MSEEKAIESPAADAEKQQAPFETGDLSRVRPRWHKLVVVPAIVILALSFRVMFTIQVERSAVPDLSRVKDVVDDGDGIPVRVWDDGTDMESYDHIARWVLKNGWYEKSTDVSPLYPYAVLPGLYALTGTDIFRTLLMQAALDTVTVLLIYLLALRLYGRRAAVYAGLAAAVYAPFIIYQGQLLGEWALGLFVAAFVLTALGFGEKTSLKRAAAAGLLFGLAVAAKPTVMALAPIALFLLWWRGGRRWKAALWPAGVAVAAALVAILPFTWRNYKATGAFHLVRGNSGIMLYMGNNPSANGAFGYPRGEKADELEARTAGMTLQEKDKAYHRAAREFMSENPGKFARLLWRKFGLFFSADEVPNNLSVKLYRQKTFLGSWAFLSFGAILPLSAAGMLFSLRRRGVLFVAGLSAAYAAAVILFIVVGRYRLAVLPLLIPAAGFAVAEAVAAFKELKLARPLGIIAVAVAVAVPVNWMRLRLFTTRSLNPSGFVTVTGPTVTIRDDSDYATPFGAWTIYEESVVTKFIIY